VRGGRRPVVLDTNVYVRALRDPSAQRALIEFHRASAPWEWLSSVVVQELRVGVSGADAARLDAHIFRPFEDRGRLVTPSYRAWKQAGAVLREYSERWGPALRRLPRSLVNDVLLALSCREMGAVLVTHNHDDFERIASVAKFEFAEARES
jgi:predicted nucleic acid-binding protein